MDSKYFAEIKAREQVATPGPWKPIEKGNTVPSHAVFAPSIDGSAPVNICSGISPKTGNADFISHARADIPALLAEVERLTIENLGLKDAAIRCDGYEKRYHSALTELDVKNQQIATLKRALELACYELAEALGNSAYQPAVRTLAGGYYNDFIHQAQEQEADHVE